MNVGDVSDSLGKAISLLATERMTQAMDFLRALPLKSYDELEDFVMVGVWNEPKQDLLFETLKQAKDSGIEYPYLIKNLKKLLRMEVSKSFHMVDKVGGISGLGSMVFEPDRGATPFQVYNPELFIANFDEGNFGRVSGVPGSGKTNDTCKLIIEPWVRPNRLVFTNIFPTTYDESGNPEYPEPNIIYVHDARDFFTKLAERGKGTKWLFILDEGGLVYSKPDAATRRAKDLDKLARVIRKLHGSFILIEQRPESVPTIIQEFSNVVILCYKPAGSIEAELKGPVIAHRAKIGFVPKTSLPYDTYDIAYFSISGVNIPAIFSAISGAKEPFDAMLDFMKKTGDARASLDICAYCGKKLEKSHPAQRYCDVNCRQNALRQRKRDAQETNPLPETEE